VTSCKVPSCKVTSCKVASCMGIVQKVPVTVPICGCSYVSEAGRQNEFQHVPHAEGRSGHIGGRGGQLSAAPGRLGVQIRCGIWFCV
jgi:hypothetical protein